MAASNLSKSQSPTSKQRNNGEPTNVNSDPVRLSSARDGENDHAWELYDEPDYKQPDGYGGV